MHGVVEAEKRARGPIIRMPQCRLVVREGTERRREVLLATDVIRVGKSRDNDLTIDEETVSRIHFEIVRDAKGYLVRDLRSTNGTFVDGAEIKEAYVRSGAVISAGSVHIEFQPLEERVELAPVDRESMGDMTGCSVAMRTVFAVIERVATTDVAVLFTGEAGTGKRLAAATLHRQSRRRMGPFVTVDCAGEVAALAAELTEGGAFDRAHGGTILLAGVEELPRDLATRLLRVLEQREQERGRAGARLDARVLATAGRSLEREVERGRFLPELRFRLEGVSVEMPPLRERREDVGPLARRFLDELGATGPDGAPLELGAPALAALAEHDWPGNVTELRGMLARAVARGEIGASRLVDPLAGEAEVDANTLRFQPELAFRDQKERFTDQFERRYLTWIMRRAEGNVSRAARAADMDRKYLHKLLRKHGLGGDA